MKLLKSILNKFFKKPEVKPQQTPGFGDWIEKTYMKETPKPETQPLPKVEVLAEIPKVEVVLPPPVKDEPKVEKPIKQNKPKTIKPQTTKPVPKVQKKK